MLRCISTAFETFERDLLDALARRGFGNIRRVQLPLFRNLGRDGTRLTELAPRGGDYQAKHEGAGRAIATTEARMAEVIGSESLLGIGETLVRYARHQSALDSPQG